MPNVRAAVHAERPPDQARPPPPLGEEVTQLANGSQQAQRHRCAASLGSRAVTGLTGSTAELTPVAGYASFKKEKKDKKKKNSFCSSSVVLPVPAADGGVAERQRQCVIGHERRCWSSRRLLHW